MAFSDWSKEDSLFVLIVFVYELYTNNVIYTSSVSYVLSSYCYFVGCVRLKFDSMAISLLTGSH